ncbi:MAG: coproporphyrinogen dehydrogenase HemZ [Firmicutes bacterium]|nr:coproporphyrinogen dehydrogenase HemZ [Bacillota bacterium]
MNFKLISHLPEFMNEVPEVLRAFFPYLKIDADSPEELRLDLKIKGGELIFEIGSSFAPTVQEAFFILAESEILFKREAKKLVKNSLYLFCKNLTGVALPYGSLTGVRPTTVARAVGCNPQKLISEYHVSPERANLLCETVKNQKNHINICENAVSIYVNIPFCASRCKYCSFISTEIKRAEKLLPEYTECVLREIESVKQTVNERGLTVRSVYVGGGTPTALPINLLEKILKNLSKVASEFTVEAGRPDSLNADKLSLLNDMGVSRISINPQSFNNQTLEALGRAHTAENIYETYEIARKFSFNINMDLIIGLPNESYADFKNSLNKTVSLKPENITVHTLSIKRGAGLKTDGAVKSVLGISAMSADYSIKVLSENNYIPYYLYRQKNTEDNLENVGYTLQGKQCVYNIDHMEEASSILAVGAGAISKFIFGKENRTERKANPKGLKEYLERQRGQ